MYLMYQNNEISLFIIIHQIMYLMYKIMKLHQTLTVWHFNNNKIKKTLCCKL